MRFQFCINAYKDLTDWKARDLGAYVDIVALVKQIEQDPALQDRLLDSSATYEFVSFSRWFEQYHQGNYLYRVKTLNVDGYSNSKWRIIYTYLPISRSRSEPEFHILAIPSRDKIDYDDPENPLTKRILADYKLL